MYQVGKGGKFTAEARLIYELVLDMQNVSLCLDPPTAPLTDSQTSIDMLKPGTLWEDIHIHCHRMLVRRFLELGIFKGAEEEVFASEISMAFFPHGLGESPSIPSHETCLTFYSCQVTRSVWMSTTCRRPQGLRALTCPTPSYAT